MSSKEVLRISIKKCGRTYSAFLVFIAVMEACMMLYGVLSFDLSVPRRRAYFGSYVFLFCVTIVALILNILLRRNEKRLDLAVKNAYVYNGVLIFWSAFVSSLEITGGGYPATHMTILAAVCGVMVLRPAFYTCAAMISSLGMFLIVWQKGVVFPVTFYMNCGIFLLVMLVIQVRNYRSAREQYILDKKLEEWAKKDALTHVANRRSMAEYIEELNQKGKGYTFALLDINLFKEINDTYGHNEGDQCLVEIAELLTAAFGRTVFRYGGDEFAVVSFEGAEAVMKKLKDLNDSLVRRRKEYRLNLCAGVYRNDSGRDERWVFEQADRALYEAKKDRAAGMIIQAEDL